MLKFGSRRKPTSVIPTSSANSTASDDGADTAHRIAMPAAAAFCTISKLNRPLTIIADAQVVDSLPSCAPRRLVCLRLCSELRLAPPGFGSSAALRSAWCNPLQGDLTVQERVPDDFVDSVVASDVLAQNDQTHVLIICTQIRPLTL